jgi:protein-L-isoaspartate(D-aspartate) O-methyltransferase
MVERFVKGLGITDKRVLEAMRKTPRHMFVEPAMADLAYEDHAAPIGLGQTITQPYTVGLLAQTAELTDKDKVLEVGTGSGYTAAVLGQLAEKVYTIEKIKALSNNARKVFNQLNYKNIVCLAGDGTKGSAKYAPYDAIIVTAGSPTIPVPLARQLVEGGRMVIPIGSGKQQSLHLIRRQGERFVVKKTEECSFVPLLGEHGWKEKPSKY